MPLLKHLLVIAMSCLLAPPLQAEYFINSLPMGAVVYVGKRAIGRTPMKIAKIPEQESRSLRFELDGYISTSTNYPAELRSKHTNIFVVLSPNTFTLEIQEEVPVYVGDTLVRDNVIRGVRPGSYSFENRDSGIAFQPSSGGTTAGLAVGATLTVVGLSLMTAGIVMEAVYKDQLDQLQNPPTGVEPGTDEEIATAQQNIGTGVGLAIAGGVTGGISLIATVAIAGANADSKNRASTLSSEGDDADARTGDEFERAFRLLRNNPPEAIDDIEELANKYPLSRYTPSGLFRAGNTAIQLRDYPTATRLLRKIYTDYPIYEIYVETLRLLTILYSITEAETQAQRVFREYKDYATERQVQAIANKYPFLEN